MINRTNELDYMIEDVEYSGKVQNKTDDGKISLKLFNRMERISLFLTQEEYNKEIVRTRIAKIATKPLEWDGTHQGASDLGQRLTGRFLSSNEFENLKKYAKRTGMTNRKRIRQFYGLDDL